MKQFLQKSSVALLLLIMALPVGTAEARYDGAVAGWVPWWTDESGVEATTRKIDEIDILYLFTYEVNKAGELVSRVDLNEDPWEELVEEAEDERVTIIPTVAWFDGEAIHDTLTDRRKRDALIDDIVEMVDENNFDGVNIDFEEKKSETIDYFSAFLRELEDELGRDELTCTIEARTPPTSLWRAGNVPSPLRYANDYEAMNRYCDWVEIMAYDQMRADLVLNDERRGVPYNPVADIDWVEKVVKLALEDIDADKILLGVPTYGRAYDVTVAPDWYRDYTRVASVDYNRIEELSEIYDVPIGRTAGGEGFISYFPNDSVWSMLNQLPTPEGTAPGYEAAAKALLVANLAGVEVPVRILTFGDAPSAKDKLDLADTYNLKGVAFFKLDGNEDSDIWKLW